MTLAQGQATGQPAPIVCGIAGLHHRVARNDLNAIKIGDRLRLEPEPGNSHDRNAVKVLLGDRQLGYLPQIRAAEASGVLQRGIPYVAKVWSLGLKPYVEDCWIGIRIDFTQEAA